jgi:hypothetical protein
MNDGHLRLLRAVAAGRRSAVRRTASMPPDETSVECLARLTRASARADAQLTAATNRRRRRANPARLPANS